MNIKGKFITFEGGEATGKTTQIKNLSKFLDDKAIPHIVTREPGGTFIAEDIRSILLKGIENKMDSLTEYLLFSAARRDHLQKVIKPALQSNKWVLCDRFYDSSYVYQYFVGDIPLSVLEYIYKAIAGDNFYPDITFVFDLPIETSIERLNERVTKANHFDMQDLSYHKKIREGFQQLAKQHPNRFKLIDANSNEYNIAHKIFDIIDDVIVKNK